MTLLFSASRPRAANYSDMVLIALVISVTVSLLLRPDSIKRSKSNKIPKVDSLETLLDIFKGC